MEARPVFSADVECTYPAVTKKQKKRKRKACAKRKASNSCLAIDMREVLRGTFRCLQWGTVAPFRSFDTS